MEQYLTLVDTVLNKGIRRKNRTGVDTMMYFGYHYKVNLQKGFPLLTTKKVHTRSIFYELLWFLRGDTNISYLNDNGVTIWDEWADESGELGPIYGVQWRSWQRHPGFRYLFPGRLHLGR